jgi:Ca-activated chloride channel family protein
VVVAARLPEGTQGTVAVTGQRGEEAWRAEADLATGRTQAGIAGLWARRQITDLERQRYDGASNDEIRDRILEVALAHQIVSEVTSLVAIDDEVVRPPEAALESEAVATNMPDGVDMTMAASPAAPVDSLTAVRTFARTGSVQLAQLPDTATWSQILMLLGGLMLALGGLLALLASRQGRPA